MTTSALSQSGWCARSFSSIISLSSAAVFRDLSGMIMTIQIEKTSCLGNASWTSHCGPNQKHYHCSNRPDERLSKVSGDERAENAQNCRKYEALRLIASRG